MEIPSAIIDMHSGSRFYAGSGEEDIPNHYRKLYFGEGYKTIAGGGSVANSAFSLAMELGFKTIISLGRILLLQTEKAIRRVLMITRKRMLRMLHRQSMYVRLRALTVER